jgi:Transposase IS116/IS110/IS902 family
MRSTIAVLEEALTGHFEDHHGFLAQAMLEHIDAPTARIESLDARIEDVIGPFSHILEQFDEITALGNTAAKELIAEIGVDVTRFPPPAHVVSWAKFAPIDKNSPRSPTWRLHRQGQPLAGRHPRRDRRLSGANQHLPRRTLPATGPPPRQEPRHRRGRQLRSHHHLAPTSPPRSPLPGPGTRLLPHEDQQTTPGT